MANVVVAFSKPDDARNIKNILTKNGFHVSAVCTSGAQALVMMGDLGSGILVCGYRLADVISTEIVEDMPADFIMLLVASPGHFPSHVSEHVVVLPMPLKVHVLVETIDTIAQNQARQRRRRRQYPRQRSETETALIKKAKQLLMERNGMTEEMAHRYLQKSSMDSGTSMAETAQMLVRLMDLQQELKER